MIEMLDIGGWPLVAIGVLSVVAWALVLLKALELRAQPWRGEEAHAFLLALRAGGSPPAPAQPGLLWRAMAFGRRAAAGGASFARSVEPYLHAEGLALQQTLPLVAIIAAVLPLLGLLGTVLGMVETFAAITASGSTEPARLADGVSRALITTQAGLVGALPLLLMHRWLASRVRRRLERVAVYARRAYASARPAANPEA